MATAAAVRSPRSTLHTRGTWPAREDRIPSTVWLAILWVGMIAGFGTDASRYLHSNPPPPIIVHFHAAVFTVWMLLLTAQVLLVLRQRVEFHRKFGWFLVGWACLMAFMGPAAFISVAAQAAKLHGPSPRPLLSVQIGAIGGFLILLAWGIALRKNPAAHKRMMILSTVSLADPGFGRLIEHPPCGAAFSRSMVPLRLLRQRPAHRSHSHVGLVPRPPRSLISGRRSRLARSRVSCLGPLFLEALAATHIGMGRSLGQTLRLDSF